MEILINDTGCQLSEKEMKRNCDRIVVGGHICPTNTRRKVLMVQVCVCMGKDDY